jgi:hypothetical protein
VSRRARDPVAIHRQMMLASKSQHYCASNGCRDSHPAAARWRRALCESPTRFNLEAFTNVRHFKRRSRPRPRMGAEWKSEAAQSARTRCRGFHDSCDESLSRELMEEARQHLTCFGFVIADQRRFPSTESMGCRLSYSRSRQGLSWQRRQIEGRLQTSRSHKNPVD